MSRASRKTPQDLGLGVGAEGGEEKELSDDSRVGGSVTAAADPQLPTQPQSQPPKIRRSNTDVSVSSQESLSVSSLESYKDTVSSISTPPRVTSWNDPLGLSMSFSDLKERSVSAEDVTEDDPPSGSVKVNQIEAPSASGRTQSTNSKLSEISEAREADFTVVTSSDVEDSADVYEMAAGSDGEHVTSAVSKTQSEQIAELLLPEIGQEAFDIQDDLASGSLNHTQLSKDSKLSNPSLNEKAMLHDGVRHRGVIGTDAAGAGETVDIKVKDTEQGEDCKPGQVKNCSNQNHANDKSSVVLLRNQNQGQVRGQGQGRGRGLPKAEGGQPWQSRSQDQYQRHSAEGTAGGMPAQKPPKRSGSLNDLGGLVHTPAYRSFAEVASEHEYSPSPTPSSHKKGSMAIDVEKLKVELILKNNDNDADSTSLHSVHSQSSDSHEGFSIKWERDSSQCRIDHYGDLSSQDRIDRDSLRSPSNGHGSDSSGRFSTEAGSAKINKQSSDKKKRGSNWYNVLSPTYKSRSEEFKKIFKNISTEERLFVDYSCAMQKDILVHGRLYITQNWICFYANIFRWETIVTIRCTDIVAMTKEKTARVIPNAIQIQTKDEKHFFTSFGTRDKTYLMLFRVWQNAVNDQNMTASELWQWVHHSYGEELGLHSSDEDYVPPTSEEELIFKKQILIEERTLADINEVGTREDKLAGLSIDKDKEKEPPDDEVLSNGDLSQLTIPVAHMADSMSLGTTSAEDSYLGKPSTTPHPPQSLQVPMVDGPGADELTDQGDTTEDDEAGEIQCTGHEHFNIRAVDEVLNFSVDQCHDHLFTDSALYKSFTDSKKTFNIVLGSWSDVPDADGFKLRRVTYTLSLNYSIGPKTSDSAEDQKMHPVTKPGVFYLIDTECSNSGLPYGDSFFIMNRYCISRLNSSRCHLRITSQIKYRKSVWGLVKGFIDKNATQGILESFGLLGNLLREESNRQIPPTLLANPQQAPGGRKKVLRRRRVVPGDRVPSLKQRGVQDTSHSTQQGTPTKGVQSRPGRDDWHVRLTADTLVRIVCAVLLVLVVFNALLFYKLWSLESRAASLHHTHSDILTTATKDVPESPEAWLQLLRDQRSLHEAELRRWQDVLSASITLVDQMKVTLAQLHDSVHHRPGSSPPDPVQDDHGGGR